MNIVYIANYIEDSIIKKRDNKEMRYQSANNKITDILKCLKMDHNVTILSAGYVKNKSFRYYNKVITMVNDIKLIYSSIIDIPIINMLSCIISQIKIIHDLNIEKKIDGILFYNYRPETALAALYAKIFLKIPLIIEYEDGYFADTDLKKISKLMINTIERIMYDKIDGAILVNENLKKRLRTSNCTVCIGVIDKIKIEKKSFTEKNVNIPIIMYSGRFDKERGIEIFLKSLKYIKTKAIINIAGYGPLDSYVVNEIDNILKAKQNLQIHKFSYLSNEQLAIELNNADILINPQRTKNEFSLYSFPSKLVEYMKYGKIIISSDIGNINEDFLIKFYNDDPVDLGDKINNVLQDLEYNRERGYMAIEFLNSKCSVQCVRNNINEIMKNMDVV